MENNIASYGSETWRTGTEVFEKFQNVVAMEREDRIVEGNI